ncbi:MAG: DUF2891 domain-containing protein [Bacteroidales bacterium]|nr:DUF2891 domain-containing protein [Bacteroidales bacterium]
MDQAVKCDTATKFLTLSQAGKLAELPLKCMQTEYPNKPGQTLGGKEDLKEPHLLHPAFYGCFDWHSSVHGHWSLVKLLKMYPQLEKAEAIRQKLKQNISKENIAGEVAYFEGEHNKSYERTYGWAWLLKLADEIRSWDDPLGRELAINLQPLTDIIISKYIEFLPKLKYPIRVGEHTNTAFGLTFARDYAAANGADSLLRAIDNKAREFYSGDQDCPVDWEPSGFDFLSPCLEEIDLMRRVLYEEEFKTWLDAFAPQLISSDFELEPGIVLDRTDGKLVHLDGLNFSRAWVLYGLANQYPEYGHLRKIADAHIAYSLPSLTDGNYEGEHWLASFAIYALAQVN